MQIVTFLELWHVKKNWTALIPKLKCKRSLWLPTLKWVLTRKSAWETLATVEDSKCHYPLGCVFAQKFAMMGLLRVHFKETVTEWHKPERNWGQPCPEGRCIPLTSAAGRHSHAVFVHPNMAEQEQNKGLCCSFELHFTEYQNDI